MKKPISQTILRYSALFEPCEEGGYTVTVPKLPGLVTEGDTFEEALLMAKDAIKGYLQVLQENRQSFPDPDEKSIIASIDVPYPHPAL